MPDKAARNQGSASGRGRAILISAAALVAATGIAIAVWSLTLEQEEPGEAAGPARITVGDETPEPEARAAAPSAPAVQLGPVPDPDLIAEGKYGALPVTASDGRKPWQVYARPFTDPENRPRIAIVVTDIGLNGQQSREAIAALESDVTFAISPYAEGGQDWVRAARAAGHEVLLIVPMEPVNYPEDDPGPYTLLTNLSHEENLDRLSWSLSRIAGYVGIINDMGSRLTATRTALHPIVESLSYRGLMLVDAAASPQSLAATIAAENDVPRAAVNRRIDDLPTESAINRQLSQLERLAEAYGVAVGLAHPYPVTIRTLKEWSEGLAARNLTLAPVTATANRQASRQSP